MNKRLRIFSIVLLSSLSLFGCNSTTAPTNTTSVPDNSMSATIDGSYWQSTSIPLVTGGATAVRKLSLGTITIAGTKVNSTTDQQVLTINLTHFGKGVDTLGISNQGIYRTGSQSDQYWATAGFNAGVATVTTFDTVNKVISGTFYFNAVNTALNQKTITNGVFQNVTWTDQ